MVPKPDPIKDRVLKLMSDKDKLEAKIREYGEILSSNDNVGMNGPLVDAEGFPRNDIDVYRVRQARQQIICLQNDHKDLMKQIEPLIHQLHAEAAKDGEIDEQQSQTYQNGTNGTSTSAEETPTVELKVIANINLVSTGSPAEDAGLCIGDQIVEFGTVNSNNFNNNLNEIGAIVRHMQNQRISLKVKRGNEILDIILIPKTWSGRGLLGCNIVLPNVVER